VSAAAGIATGRVLGMMAEARIIAMSGSFMTAAVA